MSQSLTTFETIVNGGPTCAGHIQEQISLFNRSCKDGQLIEVTRKKWHPKKTHQQCKLYFGNLVKAVVSELDDRGWTLTIEVGPHKAQVRPTTNRVKDLLYDLFAQKDDDGQVITISRMSTVQMAEFYEDCCDGLAVEPWMIYVQPPNPNWKQLVKGE